MMQPWSDLQRKSVREFRKAIAIRAERELAIAEEGVTRRQSTEQNYLTKKHRIESDHTRAQADSLARAEQTRLDLQRRHEKERRDVEGEFDSIRDAIKREYHEAKDTLEAQFRELRWTTSTMYEADKRVAKEENFAAQARCKALLRSQLGHWRIGRKVIDSWDFLDDIPALDPKDLPTEFADPWQKLEDCARQAETYQVALTTLRSPTFINGWLPYLMLVAVWLLLAAPGFIVYLLTLSWQFLLLWELGAAILLPLGYWWISRLRKVTNDRILSLWLSLRQCVHLGRKLRPICLKLSKRAYLTKKRESFRANRKVLRSLVEQTRTKLVKLRKKRDAALKKNDQLLRERLVESTPRQEKEILGIEETATRDQQQSKERYHARKQELESEHARIRDEIHSWHTQKWMTLLGDWKSACDQFSQSCRFLAKEAELWFPDWSRPLVLPKSLPQGLPLGKMHWTLEMFPDGIPKDPQLPSPDLSRNAYPALLPFPRASSLLFRAHGDGKAVAVDALQAILLRCWTAMPAGKVRCTIIDPVGRGENFSAFMHLADHEERLVDGRIWTETLQIDERMTNLTVHQENVLQKYLRNQFETLAEYNEQAGEVAEPFHFLVVSHFPVNFSEDAARRLVSLAGAGARCGIYTLVLVDVKQPMPHGFNLADLEDVSICLEWHADHFEWDDDDFGMFPLELEKAPPPARCTELLSYVGEEAVRSSKVEVPFEWIMAPRDAWWSASTAADIRIPIGRFGAQGKQYLELGHGTSQHVLIAGKTGSGKSTLLHVVISQLAMFYSPLEIELYLVDFKKGVEFKSYASMSLPHARVVAVESEREFGLSVLQRLDSELSKRGELYRTAGCNDLASYREYSKQHPESPNLPRILLIVDEFQEFFIEDDKLAQESSLLLDRLVRQGRAFGLHVLLGSQTIGGAYSLARSTIDQMAVRVALQCSEADAHLILSRDNTEARLLSRPGEGIYNAMHGMLEGNHLFQVVWLDDSKRDEILREIHSRSAKLNGNHKPIVFEGASAADLSQNLLLRNLWQEPKKPGHTWRAWLGDAVAIKDPTGATFRKQSGSNLMILGQQEEIAIGLTVSSLISLAAAVDPLLPEPSIHLVLGQALDATSEAFVAALAETLSIRVWPQRDLGTLLNQLADEIERRGQAAAPPQFLFLYGLHRLRDLRRPEDDFGFSKKGEDKTPYRQFTHVLKEGPSSGIFTLLWCDTLISMQRTFERQALREFDQRVLMQMSGADSSSLMDSPIAAKLGPQRALFYTEDQGKIEKFRPYALPSLEWVHSLSARKPDLTGV